MPISPTSSRKLNTVWRLTEFVRQFTVFTLFAWHSEECHAGKHHMLGFHPKAPERGSPRGRTVKFGCNTIEQLSEIPFSLKVFWEGVRETPFCKRGFPGICSLIFRRPARPRRQKQTDFSAVLLPFSHRPRCIISAKDRALPSPREKKKGRTRK